jgi:hypothetical protein
VGRSEGVYVADMIHERYPDLFGGPGGDAFRACGSACVLSADAVLCISEATGTTSGSLRLGLRPATRGSPGLQRFLPASSR